MTYENPMLAQEGDNLTTITNIILESVATNSDTYESAGLDPFAEAQFATDLFASSRNLLATGTLNPSSVRSALLNAAETGLSLNPSEKHAYLSIRGLSVRMAPQYRGIIFLATQPGSPITWVNSELRYEADHFKFKGMNVMPDHEFDPHAPIQTRGDFMGAYTVAGLANGQLIVEPISAEEIYAARDLSQAYDEHDPNCAWNRWWRPMCKKTSIKRASSVWPAGLSPRLSKALSISNETDGFAVTASGAGFSAAGVRPEFIPEISPGQVPAKVVDFVSKLCERLQSSPLLRHSCEDLIDTRFEHKQLWRDFAYQELEKVAPAQTPANSEI